MFCIVPLVLPAAPPLQACLQARYYYFENEEIIFNTDVLCARGGKPRLGGEK